MEGTATRGRSVTRWGTHPFVRSVALLQPPADPPVGQEEGSVHLAPVGRQHRPADDDPHLAKLAGRLHQQLAVQLRRQQLLRTPVGRRTQVRTLCSELPSNSCLTPTPALPSPSFPFPHPMAYQQLLSQQRGLSAFGHTPPLVQAPPTFGAHQPGLGLSSLPTSAPNSNLSAKV